MKLDTYKEVIKILDVKDAKRLEKGKEPISIKTSKIVRKMMRYCDRYSDGKAISIYRGHQPYDVTELRTIKGWRNIYKAKISRLYLFYACKQTRRRVV